MKVLIFGDIYGRLGRKAISENIGALREKYEPDFVIANIENATSGRGPISEHAEYIEGLGVDLMTGGDHIFDNGPSISNYFTSEKCKLIRPANFYESDEFSLVGKGYKIIEKKGKRLLVLQLLGEVFMSHKVSNPFHAAKKILSEVDPSSYDAVVVDFHRETTAEIYGLAHFLDGDISLIYGTHTHIQTNDCHILKAGTGIIGDVGMNGPFEGVIGASFASVKKRFLSGVQRGKIEQQLSGKYKINAVFAEIDEVTKKCTSIEAISFTS
ncbi:YmdB family metallophosphoesterase [Candidatus Gracilibacteria bacterium]|nr:YmdB family metallophosphoesterase [Candidatus Gracilibacteria bacterium]